MLGSVILGASDRAATQRREDKLLADQQKRQDTLLAGERAYQDNRDLVQRQGRLEDDAKLEEQRAKAAAVQALINEGLLRYEDRQDERALAAAYQTAQKLGVIDKYKTLIEGGYLKAEDAGDPAKVKLALDAMGGTASTERARTDTIRTRGDEQATDVARKLAQAEAEEQQVITKLQDLDQIVSTGGMPSDTEVLREATRRAQLTSPGRKVVPPAEIDAIIPKVVDDLRMQRLNAAAQQQAILQRQLEGVRSVRSGLVNQQNVLVNRGSFATPEPAAPSVVAPPAAAAPARGAGPMAGFLQQLDDAARANQSAPAAPAGATPPNLFQTSPWMPNLGLPRPATPAAPPMEPPGSMAAPPGRPITPSANLFPTSAPWWRAVA